MIINFTSCLQNSQVLGSDNEHMVSKLFFSINGESYESIIRQPHGSDNSFEEEPIEVETPEKLKGKINYGAFREVAEYYYRSLVGNSGSGIRVGGGSRNIVMTNNTLMQPWSVEIPDFKEGGGW